MKQKLKKNIRKKMNECIRENKNNDKQNKDYDYYCVSKHGWLFPNRQTCLCKYLGNGSSTSEFSSKNCYKK